MIPFLLLCFLPLAILDSPPPWSYSYSGKTGQGPNKINVDVFYEALCPDSKNFILNTLSPAFSLFSPHLSVTLWPYGKAMTTQTEPNYEFRCQHGSAECEGNLYHNCAEKYIKDQGMKIRFLSCMFENVLPSVSSTPDWNQIASQCSDREGVSGLLGQLYNCAVDLEGRQLHYQAGLRTGTREFIPSVEIIVGREGGRLVLDTRKRVGNLVEELCILYQKQTGDVVQPCQ